MIKLLSFSFCTILIHFTPKTRMNQGIIVSFSLKQADLRIYLVVSNAHRKSVWIFLSSDKRNISFVS